MGEQTSRKDIVDFIHGARNDLNIIAMGTQSIIHLRDDPEKLQELVQLLKDDGVSRLRNRIDELAQTLDISDGSLSEA